MKKLNAKMIVSVIILTAVVLTVIGYLVLPDILVTQITISGTAGTTMPKSLGLILPLVITILFSVLYYKNQESKKNLLLSLVGLLIYGFIFFVNL